MYSCNLENDSKKWFKLKLNSNGKNVRIRRSSQSLVCSCKYVWWVIAVMVKGFWIFRIVPNAEEEWTNATNKRKHTFSELKTILNRFL